MLSLYASGTQTCTVTTEHFLSSPNALGKFRLILDLVNMASGDVLEVRRYKMVLTAGTSRVMDVQIYYGAQPTDALVVQSEEVSNTLTDSNAVRFSIKQTFGTGRNIPWAVHRDDVGNTVGSINTGGIVAASFAAGAIDAAAIADNAIDAAAIASGAITAAKIATGAIDATNIVDGAITAAKFAAGAINAAAIADNAIDAGAIASGAITASKFAVGAIDASAIADGAIDAATFAAGAINAAAIASNAIDADAIAADAVTEIAAGVTVPSAATIADAVWDEATSGHTTAGSYGQAVVLGIIRTSTTQAGSTSTTVVLDASASAVDDFYNGMIVVITAGTAANQARYISDYVGSSKTATVSVAWVTTPANGDTFAIIPFADTASPDPTAAEIADAVWDEALSGHTTLATFGQVMNATGARTGEMTAGATTTVLPFDGFTEITANHFIGDIIVFTSGVCLGQARRITAYTSGSITVSPALTDAPADNDDFVIIPFARVDLGHINGVAQTATLDDIEAQTDDIGVAGAGLTDLGGMSTTMKAQVEQEVDDSLGGGTGTSLTGIPTIATVTTVTNPVTVGTINANVITASALATDAVNEIVDQVWDELSADHVGAGSIGERVERLDIITTGGAGGLTNARALALDNLDAAVTTRLAPTTAGRTLDVTTTGGAGIDWNNVENPTTILNLSGTTVKTATDVATAVAAAQAIILVDTDDIQARLPAALVSGRMDSSVGAMASGVVTAAAIATDAIDADAIASDAGIELADALLKRDMSAVTGEASRSPLNAMRALRNKVTRTSTAFSVKKEDDSTEAFGGAVTQDAALLPVTNVDPA